mmetsp:Transcript_23429/g.35149  ORF Transcript_23429/g.35149 Transcript_23429/m.35149 type:complete len:203 (+) Transcript_23429:3331-3939(+)
MIITYNSMQQNLLHVFRGVQLIARQVSFLIKHTKRRETKMVKALLLITTLSGMTNHPLPSLLHLCFAQSKQFLQLHYKLQFGLHVATPRHHHHPQPPFHATTVPAPQSWHLSDPTLPEASSLLYTVAQSSLHPLPHIPSLSSPHDPLQSKSTPYHHIHASNQHTVSADRPYPPTNDATTPIQSSHSEDECLPRHPATIELHL